MKNLKDIWNSISQAQLKDLPLTAQNFHETIAFSAFALPERSSIFFVKNVNTLEKALCYTDLTPVKLTSAERTIVDVEKARILSNKGSFDTYDGDQMFVSEVVYNPETNTVYVEAKREKYSLISCLRGRKFLKGSPIYKQKFYGVGVIAPPITNDGYTVLMQRSRHNTWAPPIGMLEPMGNEKSLLNIIEKVAINEIIEELLGDNKTSEAKTRIPFTSIPKCTHILFRTSKNYKKMSYIEFIVPIELTGSKERLEHVLKTKKCKDAYEHTYNYHMVPLSSDHAARDEADIIFGNNFKGIDIYHPSIYAAACFWNGVNIENQSWLKINYSKLNVYDVKNL